METRPGRQVLGELLGLLWIQPQEQCHDNGPQANPTLNPAVVDAVAQADTIDDLRVLVDVVERRHRCDVHVRVPLAWEHAPVSFDEHESACGGSECVLRWETVDVQHIGGIARSASVHHVKGVLTDATCYDGANRNAGLDDGVQAILPIADAAFIIKLDGFASQLPFTALDGGGIASTRRRVTLRLAPPRSSHS